MPSSLRAGFGDLAIFWGFGVKNHSEKNFLNVFGELGVKNHPKKSFGMCLGVMWEGINDVSG